MPTVSAAPPLSLPLDNTKPPFCVRQGTTRYQVPVPPIHLVRETEEETELESHFIKSVREDVRAAEAPDGRRNLDALPNGS